MSARADRVPGWVDWGLLPLLNLAAALAVSGLVVLAVGESPTRALWVLVEGSVGNAEAIGYTLYYATNFIFTGLAVAAAFHAGLFNIGGEGQAYVGGLGVTLICLSLDWLPWPIVIPLAVLGSAAAGAAWAFIPGWLQARRGSHVVITTIMFNFIAAAAITWLLVNVLIKPGQQSPETRHFAEHVWLPTMHGLLAQLGVAMPKTPLNVAFFWSLACALLVWLFLWRTRWGYALRAVGHSESAAVYAGIDPARVIVMAMLMSGALSGFVALNEVLGAQHRLILNFAGGAGFVGIAVALMGRNHPLGICVAAVLFGALYQGGTELSFELPNLTRDMVVAIQGLVILFCGALERLFRGPVERLFLRRTASA
ncbi:MAG: ABC transporter permease [Alphaproteobacteria bacterium]|nr:ABC transporter permease [Alphaproteobacteria bacterium]